MSCFLSCVQIFHPGFSFQSRVLRCVRNVLTYQKIQTTFAPFKGQGFQYVAPSDKGEEIITKALGKLPYSTSSPIAEQIHASVASSLENLKTSEDERDTYIDCLILHSPYPTAAATKEAWDVLSTYVPHKIKSLGVSNRELKRIGEYDFVKEVDEQDLDNFWNENRQEGFEEKKMILPSVFTNNRKEHLERDVGFDLYPYPKEDMVFQAYWQTKPIPHIAENALMFEMSQIFESIGHYQGNNKKLSMYALLLSLRLHGLVILEHNMNADGMKREMKALRDLERWTQKRRAYTRWMRFQQAAREFFEKGNWKWRDELKAETGALETEDGNREREPELDEHERGLRDWDIDEVVESALESGNPLPSRPLQDFSPSRVKYQSFDSTTKRRTSRNPEEEEERLLEHDYEQEEEEQEQEPYPETFPERARIGRAKNKRKIEQMIRDGASPTAIALEKVAQREDAKQLRKKKMLTCGWVGSYSANRLRKKGFAFAGPEKGWVAKGDAYGIGLEAGLEPKAVRSARRINREWAGREDNGKLHYHRRGKRNKDKGLWIG